MHCYMTDITSIPTIGFAHHFHVEKPYSNIYGKCKSIEIVYVEKGKLYGKLHDFSFEVNEGDFLVLFRELPIKIKADAKTPHSHYTIELICDYNLSLVDVGIHGKEPTRELLIPIVTTQNMETELLRRELINAISNINISRENNELAVAITGLNILNKLNTICCKNIRDHHQTGTSLITFLIKKYISTHLHQKILLEDISCKLEKTPNYLNSVFKNETGISIIQYVNKEKVRAMCELLSGSGMTFTVVCEAVGITDTSYGYRLFKKHMGLTPADYIKLINEEF